MIQGGFRSGVSFIHDPCFDTKLLTVRSTLVSFGAKEVIFRHCGGFLENFGYKDENLPEIEMMHGQDCWS